MHLFILSFFLFLLLEYETKQAEGLLHHGVMKKQQSNNKNNIEQNQKLGRWGKKKKKKRKTRTKLKQQLPAVMTAAIGSLPLSSTNRSVSGWPPLTLHQQPQQRPSQPLEASSSTKLLQDHAADVEVNKCCVYIVHTYKRPNVWVESFSKVMKNEKKTCKQKKSYDKICL